MADGNAVVEHDPETGEIDLTPRHQQTKLWLRYGTNTVYPSEYGGNFAAMNLKLFEALDEIEAVIGNNKDGARGKYATFDHVMSTVRPALRKHNLLMTHGSLDIQRFDTGGGVKGFLMPVHTTIFHVTSGGWKREVIAMPVIKFEPQSVGSAMSYGKRYTTLAALGLATGDEDDDGERTKRKTMHEVETPDSDMVARIKVEIEKVAEKGEQALTGWKAKEETALLLNTLEPEDFERVKRAYQMAVKAAREAPKKAGKA